MISFLRQLGRVTVLIVLFLALTAARPARVITDGADIYSEPSSEATVIESVPFDSGLAVSNQPTEGYYKVRTPSGKVGWISGTVLRMEGEAPEVEEAPSVSADQDHPLFAGSKIHVNLLGGVNFSELVDLNVLFGTQGTTNLLQAGAEFEWRFAPRFGLLLRAEWQGSTRVITDTDTVANFTVSSSSIPLQLGVNAVLVKARRFELGLGLLGGVSPLSWVSTEDLPNTSGEAPTFASTLGFVGQARLNAAIHVVSRFALLLEGGWALQITGLTQPLTSASGDELWKNTSTQEFVPASFNQSGPFLGGGIRILF